jgi:hypothetical protein
MKIHSLKAATGVLAVSALLAGPMLASPADAYGASRPQSAWHTNMTDRAGVLVGLSPVAAKVAFDTGRQRIFSISHGSYERLRSYIGDYISFDVRHNVLHLN